MPPSRPCLGRAVVYLGDDDDIMVRTFARCLDGPRLADGTASFRLLRRISRPTSHRELRTTRQLLGREPRSFETYVHDTVAAWRAAGLLDSSPGTAHSAGASSEVRLTR
ncbi:hypothetical protein [Blastococcus sp. VKM Ac-2987]|uniref:hypothetical protein n=1 Tax=Blastococcus sp. VKM Ac-2987 TaxID=3004141 RepID=UPI0022AB7679|nr:hypothetical protein [Blastococcus sp. VKM Ac-2987]MCZ2857501.1 hypothetical protein [Blastococcus sp. VKM Ac-2987]